MPDVLIRGVPDDILAVIDERAATLGLSRNEYLRRRLGQDAQRSEAPVTTDDLLRFADRFTDLADPDVMDRAWGRD